MSLPCETFVELLGDYLEGNLPESQQATLDQHLDECDKCVAYLSTFKTSIELAKLCSDQDADALPDDVPESLIATILELRKA